MPHRHIAEIILCIHGDHCEKMGVANELRKLFAHGNRCKQDWKMFASRVSQKICSQWSI